MKTIHFVDIMVLVSRVYMLVWTMTLVRSQALLGEESCLQIYSVPKKSVVCEPSQEVKTSLTKVKEDTTRLGVNLAQLSERLDAIDPSVEKDLPEEVKERLTEIEELRVRQAGQVESIKSVEQGLQTASQRLVNLEESNREEIARILEQQVQLIQLTLDKSNTSLHAEYVDQLTTSTQDLIIRLQTLEAELKDLMHSSDKSIQTKLDKIQEISHFELTEVKEKLENYMSEASERLQSELIERLFYYNLSSSHSGAVQELRTVLTSIRENQAKALKDRQDLNLQVTDLQTQVTTIDQTSTESMQKATRIQNALELVQDRVGQVNIGLLQCENQTEELMERLARVKEMVDKREHMLPRTLKIHDCQDVLQFYFPVSGVYQINLNPSTLPYEVFCDLEDTVGWTVIQRRQDGHEEFFRGWADYKDGFGDPQTEYWLGLQHLHTMTSQRNYSLQVELEDWNGKWRHAEYQTFYIEDEVNQYRIHISGYQGDAGDALSYHNGMAFSTMDRNHDNNEGICAAMCHGAWWYDDCYHSNLNGRYYQKGDYLTNTGWGDGVVWRTLTASNYYSLKTVIMKIKPRA